MQFIMIKTGLTRASLFMDTRPLMIVSCLFCYPYSIFAFVAFLHRINQLFHKEIVEDSVYYTIYNDKNGPHKGLIISGHRASHDCLLFVLWSVWLVDQSCQVLCFNHFFHIKNLYQADYYNKYRLVLWLNVLISKNLIVFIVKRKTDMWSLGINKTLLVGKTVRVWHPALNLYVCRLQNVLCREFKLEFATFLLDLEIQW